jgi:hypothetical protein
MAKQLNDLYLAKHNEEVELRYKADEAGMEKLRAANVLSSISTILT